MHNVASRDQDSVSSRHLPGQEPHKWSRRSFGIAHTRRFVREWTAPSANWLVEDQADGQPISAFRLKQTLYPATVSLQDHRNTMISRFPYRRHWRGHDAGGNHCAQARNVQDIRTGRRRQMDEAIAAYLRMTHNLKIGAVSAERIKKKIGTAFIGGRGHESCWVRRGSRRHRRQFSRDRTRRRHHRLGPGCDRRRSPLAKYRRRSSRWDRTSRACGR